MEERNEQANSGTDHGLELDTEKLPRIDITEERVASVAAEAWAALRAVNEPERPPRLVRMGEMAFMRRESGLEFLTRATLGYWLARSAVFFRKTKNAEKVVRPPAWLVTDMLAERDPDLPVERRR